MFYQVFLPPQVKRSVMITYKHGVYDLSHELPNDLRLRILGNKKISGNCLNSIEWQHSSQSPCQNQRFVNTRRKLLKNRNWTFLVVHYFTWKLELVSDILWVVAVKEKFDKKIELTDKINQIDLIYCFKGNTAKINFMISIIVSNALKKQDLVKWK